MPEHFQHPAHHHHAHAPHTAHTPAPAIHAHGRHGHGGSSLATSFHATVHCLTGCIIGEVAGVAIGVELGIGVWPTIILATTLSYISGFTLGLVPVMRDQKLGFWQALKLIWLGEAISIGVMEIVMNAVDLQMGGMTAPSVLHWSFWQGFVFAVPAGFLAAWPVNWLLLRKGTKRACH